MCVSVFRGTSLNLYLLHWYDDLVTILLSCQRLRFVSETSETWISGGSYTTTVLKGILAGTLWALKDYRLPIHKKYQTTRSKYLFWYWGESLVYLKGLLKDCCVTRFLIRYTWFSFHVLFDIWAHQPVIFQHLKLWLKVLPTIDKFRKNINVNIWLPAFSKYF